MNLWKNMSVTAARRGMGFMQGIVIAGRPVGEIVKKALEKKLLVILQEAT